ncbi:hypothetical protein ACJ41O_013905 [Fusarium nematophilum]
MRRGDIRIYPPLDSIGKPYVYPESMLYSDGLSEYDVDFDDLSEHDIDFDDLSDEGEDEEAGPDVTEEDISKVQRALDTMSGIDMDDANGVERRIAAALSPSVRKKLTLTAQDETDILSSLPSNAYTVAAINNDPVMRHHVEAHRERYRILIKRQAQLMLAFRSQHKCPSPMKGWFLFFVANAATKSRERLLRLLTHPSVQPLFLQFVLGQVSWTVDMFDKVPRVDLNDTGAPGDVVTAYIAVAHCSSREHYVYCGSASAVNPGFAMMGEARRMKEHRQILDLGTDEIVRRRRNMVGGKGGPYLFVHEKLALSEGNAYFFPAVRYPVDLQKPCHKNSAVLALVGENCNMLLLLSRATGRGSRWKSSPEPIGMSHLLLGRLRPASFPVPAWYWYGANIMLPMMQDPRAIWELLRTQRQLVSTPALTQKLQSHFDKTGDRTLLVKACNDLLEADNWPKTVANVQALRGMYADILEAHGFEYRTQHQEYLLMYSSLWVGIIQGAEEQGLVTRPDDDRYQVAGNALDWVNVSQTAQRIAPPDLRRKFTKDSCHRMFEEGDRNNYFNQKVLLRPNWDRLRCGLPQFFASPRTTMRHPRHIQLRIGHICRVKLFQEMARNDRIEVTLDDVVRLKSAKPPTIKHLREPILQQLEQDISLCPSVQVQDGAWDDEAFRYNVYQELKRAFKELKRGLDQADARRWEKLEELGPDWADPQGKVDLPVRYDELEEPETHERPSLASSQGGLDGYLQLLLAGHVEPDKITHVVNKTAKHSRDSTPKNSPEDEAEEFELLNLDGTPARSGLFSVASARKGRRRNPAPRSVPATQTDQPQDSGTCPLCLTFRRELSKHKKTCRGRCQACRLAGVACIRVPGEQKCEACKDNYSECEGFAPEDPEAISPTEP